MAAINLYSDTQTRPTRGMRQAMANAEVGDEQRGEDPTVNALCARVAAMLGQEAAVFLPSGTMANEISLWVHCQPGDEILADKTAHITNFEGGGPSALAGALITGLDGDKGRFTAAQVRDVIQLFPYTTPFAPSPAIFPAPASSRWSRPPIWPAAPSGRWPRLKRSPKRPGPPASPCTWTARAC